jgi:SlyX protein
VEASVDQEFVERVELKIAFLERANTELSDVVYRQQREIADLQGSLVALKDRLEALAAQPTAYSTREERPPHY